MLVVGEMIFAENPEELERMGWPSTLWPKVVGYKVVYCKASPIHALTVAQRIVNSMNPADVYNPEEDNEHPSSL